MQLETLCASANASIFRKMLHGSTKASFHPTNLHEVMDAVAYAKNHGVTITAKGGGSSLSGAATGGAQEKIIISTNKFRKLLEVDQKQKFAWVEPGLTPVELNAILEKKQVPLRYLVTPSSKNVATLGGMLATDAGGNDAWIRGTTRDNLLAVEIMDYHGNLIYLTHDDVRCKNDELLQRLRGAEFELKDVAASHGTLGFITKMQVTLHPISAEAQFWATFNFDGLNNFGTAINEMIHKQIPFTYAEAIAQLNINEIDSDIHPPLLIIEASETQKQELEGYGEITHINKIQFEGFQKHRTALSKKTPKSGVNFPLFEGYGVPTDQLPQLAERVMEINELLKSYNITPFFKLGHAPSKWYDQDQPCYGFIMHSREVRPDKTGNEIMEVITTIIDYCFSRGITPKPEHKWPYLQDKKRVRLIELAALFENKFNPCILTYEPEDLAAFI